MRDADEVHTLLNIVDKARGYPKLKAIHDQAMKALEDHAAGLTAPAPVEAPAPIEKEMSGEASLDRDRLKPQQEHE